jgi:hypothetical protein
VQNPAEASSCLLTILHPRSMACCNVLVLR